jgi:CubicO group peptidase (beta-lactamase class C family)
MMKMTTMLAAAPYPLPVFPDADRRDRIATAYPLLEQRFRDHAVRNHVPGVAYGVIAGGDLIFTHSFGVRTVAGQEPVDADTIFRIASMTKSFAAAAILHLRDAGRLRLDEPAATYVPELATLRYPTGDSAPITVRQLLTMNAGWPEDDPWADRQIYRRDAAMSEIYAQGVTWSNPPGVCFEYSNYGYMVLGRIITNVAGVPAVTYINRELLKPLGMDSTFWDAADVPADRLAHGHRWEDAQWKAEELLPCGGDVACFAGIFTSVRDLARWVTFFLDAWPPRDDAESGPLRRSTRRAMQQIGTVYAPELVITEDGPPRMNTGGYGFGLQISDDGHLRTVGHGGGLPGFGSHMRWLPDYDLGIVALGNVTYAGYRTLCTDALGELVAAAQLQPRRPQVSPALIAAREGILRLMTAWDNELAADLFADNVLLDSDAAHRQQELAALLEQHGPLRPDGDLQLENWLRGRWHMVGAHGWVDVSITMTPTVPPRVQEWSFTSSIQENN